MQKQTIKVQTTLKGYSAWVFQRLIEARNEPPADIAKMMFDLWVTTNVESLRLFGITHEQYRREVAGGGELVQMPHGATTDRSDVG